jgi:hypothetical protein
MTWFEWDGGSVQGNSTRFLPVLRLQGLMWLGQDPPSVALEVTAAGKVRSKVVPIELVSVEDWVAEDTDRAHYLPEHLRYKFVKDS